MTTLEAKLRVLVALTIFGVAATAFVAGFLLWT